MEDAGDVTDTKPVLGPTVPFGYWIEKRYKSRSSYRNVDLPPQCQDQRWSKIFLPTVLLWAGSQSDVWQISDSALLSAMQDIFDVVYPDLKYTVTFQGSVFGVVRYMLHQSRIILTNHNFTLDHTASR